MSDDRLFCFNNAISQKGYLINIIFLALIVWATNFIFNHMVFNAVRTEDQAQIAKYILHFIYFIYVITYLSLIDRRLYDIFETRSAGGYKICSFIIEAVIFIEIAIYVIIKFNIAVSIPYNMLHDLSSVLNGIFIIMTFILICIKGKITENYKNSYKKKNKF